MRQKKYEVKVAEVYYHNYEVMATSPEEAVAKACNDEGKDLGLEYWNPDSRRGTTVMWNQSKNGLSGDSVQLMEDEVLKACLEYEAKAKK